MTATDVAMVKSKAIGKYSHSLVGIHPCTLGVRDVGMITACRIFTFNGQFNRLINIEVPSMIEIKVRKFSSKLVRFG